VKPRMNFYQAAPDTMKALGALEAQVQASRPRAIADRTGQDPRLADQRLRLLHQHAHPGRTQARRDRAAPLILNAWRESPLYTDRERAALAWTEAVTLISETHAPDEDYEAVRAQFSEAETVNLTMLIATINAWNRISISFRAVHPVKAKAVVA
jgi:alkylhydroperoxidase family enzyme